MFHSNRTEKGTGVRGCVELCAEGSAECMEVEAACLVIPVFNQALPTLGRETGVPI